MQWLRANTHTHTHTSMAAHAVCAALQRLFLCLQCRRGGPSVSVVPPTTTTSPAARATTNAKGTVAASAEAKVESTAAAVATNVQAADVPTMGVATHTVASAKEQTVTETAVAAANKEAMLEDATTTEATAMAKFKAIEEVNIDSTAPLDVLLARRDAVIAILSDYIIAQFPSRSGQEGFLEHLARKGKDCLLRRLYKHAARWRVLMGERLCKRLLHVSTHHGHANVVQWVYSIIWQRYGVGPFAPAANVALWQAAELGHVAIVRFLCELPQDRGVDAAWQQNLPLRTAVRKGHADVVRYLCRLPANRGVDLAPAVTWFIDHDDVELMRVLCDAGETRGVHVGDMILAYIRMLPLDMLQYLYALIMERGIEEAETFNRRADPVVCYLRHRRQEQLNLCDASLLEHTVDDGGWACRLAFQAVHLGLPLPSLQCLLEQLETIDPACAPAVIDAVLYGIQRRGPSAFDWFCEDHALALTYAVLVWHGGDMWLRSDACGEMLNRTPPQTPSWRRFMAPVYTRIQTRRHRLCVWRRRRTLLLMRLLRDRHRAAPRSKIDHLCNAC